MVDLPPSPDRSRRPGSGPRQLVWSPSLSPGPQGTQSRHSWMGTCRYPRLPGWAALQPSYACRTQAPHAAETHNGGGDQMWKPLLLHVSAHDMKSLDRSISGTWSEALCRFKKAFVSSSINVRQKVYTQQVIKCNSADLWSENSLFWTLNKHYN